MRPLRVLLLIWLILTPMHLLRGQAGGVVNTPDTDTLSAGEKVKRDALLRPGLDKLKANDAAGAFAAFGPALAAYPNDLRVLRYAAQSALLSRQYPAACELFTRALTQKPTQPWPLRLGRMQAEARLNKWSDFDQDLANLRAAKKANDPQLAGSNGFVIDEFEVDGQTVQAIVFPLMASHFHTLYRFLLPRGSDSKRSAQAAVTGDGPSSVCNRPDFQPYIDLESDDADQAIYSKAHPEQAAQGDREFSLDSYPGPCSQALMRFFSGEPRYEDVRAIVAQPAKPAPKTAK
jgi:hypothetical protein